MRSVADVTTDDLVNSLLNSVTSTSSDNSTATDSASSSSTSSSSSASLSSSGSSSSSTSGSTHPHATTKPTTTRPSTSSPSTSLGSSGSNQSVTGQADTSSDGGSGGAGLSIGIAIGVLALVAATLLFLRSRRKRQQKERDGDSTCSPPAGATCLTVPAGRGFTQEQRELGMPEMSIELPPGEHLGFSKGFDQSYASSVRSSASSNAYNPSTGSESSVFNTMGGVSPTFSSRKMASYSYQYRASSDDNIDAKPSLASARSAGSTTFRLTQLAGTASNRGGNTKLERVPSGRTLSAADEYAEMVTATNAHQTVDMEAHSADFTKSNVSADFTRSSVSADFTNANAKSSATNSMQNELEMSMGPDSETNVCDVPIRVSATPSAVRASDISMGPDSPSEGRSKRSGSVYDAIPKLSGENMAVPLEEENMSASFLSEASEASDDQHTGAPSLGMLPLLQSMSSAESSDYGEDLSSERASTDSTDSANAQRPGSLIALNLEAKDGTSEIAI